MHGGIKMKKILITLLFVLFGTSAFASADNCIYLKSDAVENAIVSLVHEDYQFQAQTNYDALIDPDTGCISIMNFYRVCNVAGYNLEERGGFNDCQKLLQTMISMSGYGDDGYKDCIVTQDGMWTTNAKGEKECVDKLGYTLDYRNACEEKDTGGLCTRRFQTVSIAYAAAKTAIKQSIFPHYNLSCLNRTTVEQNKGNYLYCSKEGKPFTIKFQSFKTDSDEDVAFGNIAELACRHANLEYKAIYVSYGDEVGSPKRGMVCMRDNTDKPILNRGYIGLGTTECSQIDTLLKELAPGMEAGRVGNESLVSIPNPGIGSALPIRNVCVIHGKWRVSSGALRNDLTEYGINSYEFANLEELRNSEEVIETIRKYIRMKMVRKPPKKVECDVVSRKTYTNYDPIGFYHKENDIIGCTVNWDKRVDFIVKKLYDGGLYILADEEDYLKSGISGLECLAADGVFDGSKCRLLGEENCKQLQDVLKDSCPECSKPVWTGTTCELPDAADIDRIQKWVKIGKDFLTIFGGAALILLPGTKVLGIKGIASTWGGNLVMMGATAEFASNTVIRTGIFKDWADRAEQCHDQVCAERLINQTLQEIQSYKKDFTDAEQDAVDQICAYLFGLIPTNSAFWLEFLQNDDMFDPETCQIKEKHQLWHYIREAGQWSQLIGGLQFVVSGQKLKKGATKVGSQVFSHTTDKITSKITELVSSGALTEIMAGMTMTAGRTYMFSTKRPNKKFKVPKCLENMKTAQK